jgi:hypothetical protein
VDFSWERERWVATGYAVRRLSHRPAPAEPGDFGVVWANMTRGAHLGELRELPAIDSAFDDWLWETTAAPASSPAGRPACRFPVYLRRPRATAVEPGGEPHGEGRRYVPAHVVNGQRPCLACGPHDDAKPREAS